MGAIINVLCFFVALFLLPFYFTRVLGWSIGQVGLVLTVMPVLMMALAPWAGSASDRVGLRGLSSAGMFAYVLGLAVFGLPAMFPALGLVLLIMGLVLWERARDCLPLRTTRPS